MVTPGFALAGGAPTLDLQSRDNLFTRPRVDQLNALPTPERVGIAFKSTTMERFLFFSHTTTDSDALQVELLCTNAIVYGGYVYKKDGNSYTRPCGITKCSALPNIDTIIRMVTLSKYNKSNSIVFLF